MIRVSLLSVAAVLAFAAGTVPSAFAKDGVYTSTTLGRNGDVTVQTTITNGRIADECSLVGNASYAACRE
ncbi:MAG: hypothetical protein ACLT49_10360 [Sutterella wadsworthensis]